DDGDVCLSGIDLDEEDGLDIDDPEDDVPDVQITSD
ncbi:MAG: Rieske (2Fe-2S) protein, partial [Bradyrhizobium sp.]|nr:Rieske (2Fe-2S) protein [Bradyrhizobium sp.]